MTPCNFSAAHAALTSLQHHMSQNNTAAAHSEALYLLETLSTIFHETEVRNDRVYQLPPAYSDRRAMPRLQVA